MRNLIDSSYFILDLKIEGNTTNTSGTVLSEAANRSNAELDQYITRYQKKYLIDMFGETLAEDMPQELIDMIVDADTKESPIANYVYYFYSRDKNTITPPAQGVNSSSYFRAQLQSKADRSAAVWNAGVEMNNKVHQTLYDDETITIFVGEENEQTLTYLDDILPEVKTTSNIFEYINSINL